MSDQRYYPTSVFDTGRGARRVVHRVRSDDGGALHMQCGLIIFAGCFGPRTELSTKAPGAAEACPACQ